MKSKTSSTSRSTSVTGRAAKALRTITHSRTAGVVAAVVGAAATAAAGVALAKKARASSARKKRVASVKRRTARKTKAPRAVKKAKA